MQMGQLGRLLTNGMRTAALLALAAMFSTAALAAEFVGTNINSGQIVYIATPKTSVMMTTTGSKPDGIILGPFQEIIYVLSGAGTVHTLNPYTRIDTTLATGLTTPTDLVMEPGCKTILVSDIGVNKIYRVNLSTHAVTTFFNGPDKIQGLTYDNSGNLFAADDQLNAIVQIDPVSGVILNQTSAGTPLNSLEGITFDGYTGQLFATSNAGQVLYEVTTDLSTITTISFTAEPVLHGIVSDSKGNLYVVGANGTTSFVLQYSIITGTEQTLNNIAGLEDIAQIYFGPCLKGRTGDAAACADN